ncbi:MAG TPA: peptidylprolyl isomerase [Ferruginibacter sp.]|nr:peptidylprolyl isomerase [Ferruginibacter sp.]
MFKYCLIIFTAFAITCNQPDYKNPHVLVSTRLGDIEIELFPEQAPKTVAAFLSYVDSGFYTNSSFYRVLKAEELPTESNTGIIQGGIWQTNPKQKVLMPGVVHETTKQSGLSHVSGTISLARTTPGSANTEFFICIGDQTPLDEGRRGTEDGQGFAAFGKVFKGMAVVREIQAQQSHGDSFDKKINIYKITRL